MNDLTILGGGPAGLGVAFYAQSAGIPFHLFEKTSQLGGLCRTLTCGEHLYDTGAHRFHNRDPEITHDLMQLMGNQLFVVTRPSKVLISGQFLDFPPTPLNMLRFAGISRVGRIGLDLIRSRWKRKEIRSFADFAIQKFGETLAKLFLTNYSEKVWGLPADRLSPTVATRRLSGMNLKTLIVELLLPSSKTSHLDGHFLYPRGGYGKIVENLAGRISSENIHLDHEIIGFELRSGRIARIRFRNGYSHEVNGRVVSTLPITRIVEFLQAEMNYGRKEWKNRLRFRSVRLIFLRLKQPEFTKYASLYIPDPHYCISRIYEPRNRCSTMSPPGETGIVLECPCFKEDPVGKLTPTQLYQRVVDELRNLGILDSNSIIDWRHHLLPHAYPVYSLDYEEELNHANDMVREVGNLDTLGRNGSFFYSHLHDQLRFGKDYIRRISGNPDQSYSRTSPRAGSGFSTRL